MVVAEVMVPMGISGPEHRAYILIPHIKKKASIDEKTSEKK